MIGGACFSESQLEQFFRKVILRLTFIGLRFLSETLAKWRTYLPLRQEWRWQIKNRVFLVWQCYLGLNRRG
jgi:hypothetical protein